MVSFTRNQAQRVRNVLQRAGLLGRTSTQELTIEVRTGPEGLTIRCQNYQAAVEYHEPGNLADTRVTISARALDDFGGRDQTSVTLESVATKQVAARWTQSNVPQFRLYDEAVNNPAKAFPSLPESFVENPPGTLQRLDDACQTCAQESIRYALENFQLRGERGQVVATDGRHAFQQTGFSFPWQEDLLVPRTRVFGCKELSVSDPVRIGRLERWAVFQVGPWTIWLALDITGTFPRTDDLWPIAERATSRVEITPEDARFLAARIGCLPGDQEVNFPVTC